METTPQKDSPEDVLGYKGVVDRIRNLRWENLDAANLQRLMYLSYVSAREFAAALRMALELYPDNMSLREMAEGELETSNLSYEGYKARGDHADFLDHFIEKECIQADVALERSANEYLEACNSLANNVRAMTIFSREKELPGIFKRILEAPNWAGPGLTAFRYYLDMHIKIDTQEGGHGDLTADFPIDERVKPFYEARLRMYRVIPRLFEE